MSYVLICKRKNCGSVNIIRIRRRCGRCQESVKFAEKDRFPEIMYPIPTDTPEENGMLIFRL